MKYNFQICHHGGGASLSVSAASIGEVVRDFDKSQHPRFRAHPDLNTGVSWVVTDDQAPRTPRARQQQGKPLTPASFRGPDAQYQAEQHAIRLNEAD